MKQFFVIIVLVSSIFVSCDTPKKVEVKEKLVMYQPSELALLMEEMYVHNDSLKNQILNGETLTQFPEEILNIHTAEMTSNFSRDETFLSFADAFVENQKAIYIASPENAKQRYNTTINTCIACHQTSCTGAIPKIQKLLID